MLVWLSEYLSQFDTSFRVFGYLTLRSILAAGTALAIALITGPATIRYLHRLKVGQAVRDDGPQTHLVKAGTPTMGGILILSSVALSTLLWGDLENQYVWVTLLVTLGFGIVGWVDDYRKVVERDSRGLPARWKYFWQSVLGLAAAYYLYAFSGLDAMTELYVPFLKDWIHHQYKNNCPVF